MQLSTLYLEQIQAAKEEGKLEGEQQKQQEIAIKLLRGNVDLEVIAAATGLSIDRLQTLHQQLQDH